MAVGVVCWFSVASSLTSNLFISSIMPGSPLHSLQGTPVRSEASLSNLHVPLDSIKTRCPGHCGVHAEHGSSRCEEHTVESMKVKLQNPTGAELASFNPILPPFSITQVMLLTNLLKEKVRLRYKLMFLLGERQYCEVCELDQFPPPERWGNLSSHTHTHTHTRTHTYAVT
ncbi:ADP-ribosylation factor-binding protein GGA3-like, partial [Clarias magur]